MRLLVIASMYPHPGLPYSGIFNRNCVEAMVRQGHDVVVLAPKPYTPKILSVHPRWAAYAQIPKYSAVGGTAVHRPSLVQVPRVATTFQRNQGAFLQTRRLARNLHDQHPFDAVFSFDLSGAGGLAWRLGQHLQRPATGWAFGLDVRVPQNSSDAAALRLMLRHLDLVFYQSTELRQCAESYLEGEQLSPSHHIVLPHGIPSAKPPSQEVRQAMRKRLGIAEEAFVVLFLSRIVKGKGIEELAKAYPIAAKEHSRMEVLLVGATPGFDDSQFFRERMTQLGLGDRVRLLPACTPDEVSDYHACADLFAFPSHNEGMPNALLEAMALGTPSVVFDIPPIREITRHGDCLVTVPAFQPEALGQAISTLASQPERRQALATQAREVVATHFDIDRNMGQAVEQLQELLH